MPKVGAPIAPGSPISILPVPPVPQDRPRVTVPPSSSPLPPEWRALAVLLCPAAANHDAAAWRETEALVAGALARRPATVQRQLAWFVRAIEWLAVPYAGGRFSTRAPAQQLALLRRLERSRVGALRRALWGLRTLTLFGVYGRPGMRAQLGWRPDPRGWDSRTPGDRLRPTPSRGVGALRLVP